MKSIHRNKFRRGIAVFTAFVTSLLTVFSSVQAAPIYCRIDGCNEELSVIVTPATCTQEGIVSSTCPVHGTRTEVGAFAAHNYRKVAGSETEADCLHPGTYIETCIECQDTVTVNDPKLPVLGHDLEHREEQAPKNGMEGIREHYICGRCGALFSDEEGTLQVTDEELIIPHVHQITVQAAKDPTEEQEGNISYWYCRNCEACFADKDAKEEINRQDTVLPKLTHEMTYSAGKEATEEEEGSLAYWHCRNCGRYFRDENAKEELGVDELVIPRKGHNLVFIPGSDATEEAAGVHAHYRCTGCGKLFLDEDATSETEAADLHLARLDHLLEKIDMVPPSETAPGNVQYYRCGRCGRMFAGPDGKTELLDSEVRIPPKGHSHVLKEVPLVEATETEIGNIRHYRCEECGKFFADADGIQELTESEIKLAAMGHVHHLSEVPGRDATETDAGNIRHYLCEGCGKIFADSEGKTELVAADVRIPPKGHIHLLKEIPSVEATETETGIIRHYRCEECGKFFADADGIQELTESEIRLPATGHLHLLTEVPDREATETEAGNIRHYLCGGCGKCFADPNGVRELTEIDIRVPATGHIHHMTQIPAVDASETSAGNIQYFFCDACGRMFSDTEGMCELTAADVQIPPKGHVHALKAVPGTEATETMAGTMDHYICTSCGRLYADAAGITELTGADLRVPAKGHTHRLTEIPAKEAGEVEAGNIRHYVCNGCGKIFADPDGKTELSASEVQMAPVGHTLDKVEGQDPTENVAGWKPHWKCSGCGALFMDEQAAMPVSAGDLVLLPERTDEGHTHTYTEHVTDPTCTAAGIIAYTCTGCGNTYTAEGPPATGHAYDVRVQEGSCTQDTLRISRCSTCGEEVTERVTAAQGHMLIHVGGTAATADAAGSLEHWHCTVCNKLFADADGTEELSAGTIVIPALGISATPMDKGPMQMEGYISAGTAPKTGDESALSVYLWMLCAAGVAIVLVLLRRKIARADQ